MVSHPATQRLLRDLGVKGLLSNAELKRIAAETESISNERDLLSLLERQNLLSSFQIEKISKGELDRLLIGGCKILYHNGSGSFARLYRGERFVDKANVAVKILRERWAKIPQAVELFRKEGEYGKRIHHPNTCAVHDVGSDHGQHYIVMEFIEGTTLKDFLKSRHKLSPGDALNYTLQINRGLEAAYKVGLTHRDVRLSNVLITVHGQVKLIDFGLATEIGSRSSVGQGEASALEYISLEENGGSGKNDPRSDLFFLGGILYELLSGTPPYEATKKREERLDFNRYRHIRPINEIEAALPASVVKVVDKFLQSNARSRYQNPTESCEALESVIRELNGQVATATPPRGVKEEDKIVVVVENREKMQDTLRDYLSKHGYRVILLADADRALTRLKTLTPHAVVFMADAIGTRVSDVFASAVQLLGQQSVSVIAVLGDAFRQLEIPESKLGSHGVILRPPMNLRSLRQAIESAHKDLSQS